MPVTVATSTAAEATAYGNQRKVDRCQNGVLWAMYLEGADLRAKYSTDNGATWTLDSAVVLSNVANASFFIDLDDYAHVAVKQTNGYIYYRRGTPNAGRTAWTWSAATEVYNDTSGNYPDIVAHREGSDWRAHIVIGRGTSGANGLLYARVNITSAGVISVGAAATAITSGTQGANINAFPSIDFNHTGDGKTVAGSTPHLYVAWSAGATGAGNGIRFKKATYSAGAWTWGTEREIDSTKYVSGSDGAGAQWLNCLFDGTRVVIVGSLESGGVHRMIYERDAGDTATTTLHSSGALGLADRQFYGSATYDSQGNLYVFGRNSDETAGTYDLVYRKWTRSGSSIGPEVVIDAGVGDPYVSAKRGYSNSRIEFIYTDGTASPYTVTFDAISLNNTPNVPTALTVTSDVLDTTPVFSANISDPDTSQQIKGRFQIYQNDGTTLVGTVDSALRTGAGTVTAEYSSALPTGNYKVQAATVDDAGAISAYTSQVAFSIKVAAEEDINLLWKTDALITKDSTYIWTVLVSNQKDITFTWNTTVQVEEDIALRWGLKTPWTVVDSDLEAPVLWEKVSP